MHESKHCPHGGRADFGQEEEDECAAFGGHDRSFRWTGEGNGALAALVAPDSLEADRELRLESVPCSADCMGGVPVDAVPGGQGQLISQ